MDLEGPGQVLAPCFLAVVAEVLKVSVPLLPHLGQGEILAAGLEPVQGSEPVVHPES